MISVIVIRQTDGCRYLALSAAAAKAVRDDRTMLDHVEALACFDVDRSGRRTWEHPLGCHDTAEGRAAIRAHLLTEEPLWR